MTITVTAYLRESFGWFDAYDPADAYIAATTYETATPDPIAAANEAFERLDEVLAIDPAFLTTHT